MADLISAAAKAGHEIKPRLITDWASLGLLDQPDARGLGRGKGKSYTWPAEQAGLLTTLLNKRREGVGRIALLNLPVATWLIWGDRYTPLRQARRALATWAKSNLQVGPEKVGRTLRETLKRLDHPDATDPDRRHLRKLLEKVAFGQPYDRAELVERIRRVMDPNRSGLVRGLPEGTTLTPERYAETVESRLIGSRHAERDDLNEQAWIEARHVYLTQGPVAPFLDELRRPNSTGILAPNAHARFEYAVNGACSHLVQILGQRSNRQQAAPQHSTP